MGITCPGSRLRNNMWLEYAVYDFVNWTVTPYRRWIDLEESFKHNALLQMCTTATAKRRRKQARLRNGRKMTKAQRADRRLANLKRK